MRKWRRDEPLFARGPWPEHERKFLPGSFEEDQARDIARAAAFALTDPVEQAKALRRVDDTYGIKPTSQTLAAYRGGSGR